MDRVFMRIVLATSRFTDSGGGIAVYAREFCRLLSEQGHEILVISTEADLLEEKKGGGRKVQAVSFPVGGDRDNQCENARRMFERIVSFNPDTLVSSDHSWLVSLFPCFAGRRVRISISHSSCARPIVLPAVACPAETDWIVTLSEAGKDWVLRNTQAQQDQVVPVFNPVPAAGIVTRETIWQRAAEQPLRLVFPGGSNGNKGADVMLRLAAAIHKTGVSCELVWMGRDLIHRYLPPESRCWIRLTGVLSHAEAQEQIARSHGLFLPSRGEGCPMTLLEALRSGCIPFVSDCPSAMRELVREGESGFVSPVRRFPELSEKIQELTHSVEQRRTLMLGARAVYESHLTSEHWFTRMLPLLETRREGRVFGLEEDVFDASRLALWHRQRGSWKCPSLEFLKDRMAMGRHWVRCALAGRNFRRVLRQSQKDVV